MRSYPQNSANAAGRLLALSMVIDGNLAPAELRTLSATHLLDEIDIDVDTFQGLIGDLCEDMLESAGGQRNVELEPDTLDTLLAEITAPLLRRKLLGAMSKITDADGVLTDAEATLLAHAAAAWSGDKLPAAA